MRYMAVAPECVFGKRPEARMHGFRFRVWKVAINSS